MPEIIKLCQDRALGPSGVYISWEDILVGRGVDVTVINPKSNSQDPRYYY